MGPAFSTARDRAISSRAAAGIVIERNLNFLASTNNGTGERVFYAGTRLTQLEEILPRFRGDAGNDFVMTIETTDSNGNPVLQCLINLPLDHDPANDSYVVLPGDEIIIGDGASPPSYQVKEVLMPRTLTFADSNPGDGMDEDLCGTLVGATPLVIDMLPLNIVFDNDNNSTNALDLGMPDFVSGEAAPGISTPEATPDMFLVPNVDCSGFALRQLRKVSSSSVDLPAGYTIDLRYSGPFDSGDWDGNNETYTVFGLALDNDADEASRANKEIQLLFDSTGNLDQVGVNGGSFLVGQSIHLFVNEFKPDEILPDTAQQAELLLNKANALWVTIGMQGGTNIAYNVPPGSGTVDTLITDARGFTRIRASAAQ